MDVMAGNASGKSEELRKIVAAFIKRVGGKQKKKKLEKGKPSGPLGREVGRGLGEIVRKR
jgi:hypothetical protein